MNDESHSDETRHWSSLLVPPTELRKAILHVQVDAASTGHEAVGFFCRRDDDGVVWMPALNISDRPEVSFEIDGEHIYRLDELGMPPVGILHSHFRNPRASKSDISAFPSWSEMQFGLVWCLQTRTLVWYDADRQVPVNMIEFPWEPRIVGREEEW